MRLFKNEILKLKKYFRKEKSGLKQKLGIMVIKLEKLSFYSHLHLKNTSGKCSYVLELKKVCLSQVLFLEILRVQRFLKKWLSYRLFQTKFKTSLFSKEKSGYHRWITVYRKCKRFWWHQIKSLSWCFFIKMKNHW